MGLIISLSCKTCDLDGTPLKLGMGMGTHISPWFCIGCKKFGSLANKFQDKSKLTLVCPIDSSHSVVWLERKQACDRTDQLTAHRHICPSCGGALDEQILGHWD